MCFRCLIYFLSAILMSFSVSANIQEKCSRPELPQIKVMPMFGHSLQKELKDLKIYFRTAKGPFVKKLSQASAAYSSCIFLGTFEEAGQKFMLFQNRKAELILIKYSSKIAKKLQAESFIGVDILKQKNLKEQAFSLSRLDQSIGPNK